jgi:peroxiredoxin
MALANTNIGSHALIVAEGDHTSLNGRMSAYREQSGQIRPEFAKAYDDLIVRLGMLDRGDIGPKVGESFPQFHLPDQRGEVVSLEALTRTGPTVISFNRGHWCPYCKLELRALSAIYGEIRQSNARLVSIMPDNAQFTAEYQKENALPFPVLSDIDLGFSLSLGLIFWIGEEIAQLYRGAGVDLAQYHGNPGKFLPMAAKFIVGQDGLVKARQVNVEFRQRMEPNEILAELRKLHVSR